MLFELPPRPSLPVAGDKRRFPVHRIFCVGQNYEAHAREMGLSAHKSDPIYFTKTPSAVCQSGSTIAYPPGTQNCHYEAELVAAIGSPAFRVSTDEALTKVFGYACGLDMTRRDLQNASRNQGRPWDTAKDFEHAAVLGPVTPADSFGAPGDQRLTLTQNSTLRQDARLSQMIWPLEEIIADLSKYYHLQPGDLIFTGTPAGVGPIAPGDVLIGQVEGLEPVELHVSEAE